MTPRGAHPDEFTRTASVPRLLSSGTALGIDTGVVLLVATVPYLYYSIWFHWLTDPQALPFAYIESAYILDSVALVALGLHFIWRNGQPMEGFGVVRPSWWDIPGGLAVMAVVWAINAQLIGPSCCTTFPTYRRTKFISKTPTMQHQFGRTPFGPEE